jgi:ATP-binding cassette subfamily B protein
VIEESLATVLEGVSALLVVHRPSTLALADRVVLIDGGRIAATGTHTELMKSNELYRALLSQEYDMSEQGGVPGVGSARPGASRGDVPPQKATA